MVPWHVEQAQLSYCTVSRFLISAPGFPHCVLREHSQLYGATRAAKMRRFLVLVCAAFTAGGFQLRVWCAPPRLRAASVLLSGGVQDSDSIATGGERAAGEAVKMFSLYLKVHDDFFEDELKRLFPAEQRSRVTYLADMLMMVCYLSPSDASSIASAFEWGGGRKLVGTWEQAIAEHACEGMENAGLDVFLVPAYLHRDEALEAIKEDGNELQHASLELRADRNVVLAAVRQAGGLAIAYASPGLQADREIVLEAVRQNGDALQYASTELWADREVLLEAVRQNGDALQYASTELQADREVLLEAVRQNGDALRYASAELWADREVVLEAVRQNGDHDALRYASTELRADICEVLLEGGRENKGQALLFASRELWADRGFFQEAVRQNGNALRYATDADPELEADRELVLEAVRQNGNAIRHASRELWVDREVVLEAVRQNGNTLRFVTEVDYKLKKDREVVLAAVAAQGYWEEELGPNGRVVPNSTPEFNNALRYASYELRADREVVLAAVQAHGLAILDASEELQRDPEVFRAARVMRMENGYQALPPCE